MKKLLLVLAVAFLPGIASAAALLSFDNPTSDGGTISYDGAGGPLIGVDVIFQQVIGVGTPASDAVSLFCYPVNCLLNFTTGDNLTEGPPVYTFGGGGTLSLTGGLNTAADGSGLQVVAAGSLLASNGNFDAPAVVLGGASGGQFTGIGFDFKDEDLTAFYGIDNDLFNFVASTLSLDGGTFDIDTKAFTASVTDADFANTAVPEPATLLLLGTGLAGIGWISKRRHAA